MSKKKSKINFHSMQAKCLMKCFALCEGRMTRKDMELLGSKKLTSQLISGNYVKRNKDNSYSSTDKLLKEYRNVFRPDKGFSYGTSKSTNHSKGEARILSFINKETLLKARIQTAKELSEEHKNIKKSEEYQEALENYRSEIKQELSEFEGKTDAYSYLVIAHLRAVLKVLESSEATSSPDLRLHDFPLSDIDKMIAKMQYSLAHDKYSACENSYMTKAIEQLREIKEEAYSRGIEEVSLSFEIITISYSKEAILQKMIYSEITHTNTIFIFQGGV